MTNQIIIPQNLLDYLNHVDTNYQHDLMAIPLFKKDQSSQWGKQQQYLFAATFYHLRGHFIDLMWYIANFSTNNKIKNIILENILEEIGKDSHLSHEMLYEQFAAECGVNIRDEITQETHYYSFAREYNKKHIKWLSEHDNDEQFAAFAAYERLDNIDYPFLVQLINKFKLSPKALTFFNVHTHVCHFENTLEALLPIWENNPAKLKTSFNFIYEHQLQMWRQLSDFITNQL